ncbi:hypothetical protein VNO78_11726 [Psophocarpus tetragonolobus]|uniref:Uncharacterized protein n=1 Tax=Psophocarpus tetragonolobus TaxID=3891 RepID=A0AAN9SNS1_PSOTE
MGCCVSSNHKVSTSSPLGKFHDPPKPFTKPSENNSVEETVKEVLLETPKWNPTTFAKSKPQKPHQNTNFSKIKEEKSKVEKRALSIYKAEDTYEARSLSETMSTTTSITDQREETRKRVHRSQAKLQKNRSFSGERRERTVHGARNSVGSVRLAQCRAQTGQNIGTRCRRDLAENSFRQTRSPSIGDSCGEVKPVMGRIPSVRKTNRSSARVRTGTAENGCRNIEKPPTAGKRAYRGESLENPLVSLECFIFI